MRLQYTQSYFCLQLKTWDAERWGKNNSLPQTCNLVKTLKVLSSTKQFKESKTSYGCKPQKHSLKSYGPDSSRLLEWQEKLVSPRDSISDIVARLPLLAIAFYYMYHMATPQYFGSSHTAKGPLKPVLLSSKQSSQDRNWTASVLTQSVWEESGDGSRGIRSAELPWYLWSGSQSRQGACMNTPQLIYHLCQHGLRSFRDPTV